MAPWDGMWVSFILVCISFYPFLHVSLQPHWKALALALAIVSSTWNVLPQLSAWLFPLFFRPLFKCTFSVIPSLETPFILAMPSQPLHLHLGLAFPKAEPEQRLTCRQWFENVILRSIRTGPGKEKKDIMDAQSSWLSPWDDSFFQAPLDSYQNYPSGEQKQNHLLTASAHLGLTAHTLGLCMSECRHSLDGVSQAQHESSVHSWPKSAGLVLAAVAGVKGRTVNTWSRKGAPSLFPTLCFSIALFSLWNPVLSVCVFTVCLSLLLWKHNKGKNCYRFSSSLCPQYPEVHLAPSDHSVYDQWMSEWMNAFILKHWNSRILWTKTNRCCLLSYIIILLSYFPQNLSISNSLFSPCHNQALAIIKPLETTDKGNQKSFKRK